MFPRLGIFHIVTIVLLSNLWRECGGDVFSAMFKMEHLLDTRQRVIRQLDDYIHKEENRLRELKMYSTMYKREHERAMKDMTHYTGNPINAFILIKRLTSDLDDIEKRINKTTEFVSVRNVSEDDKNVTILYPTAVDLQGAALALKRLQRTYKLKVEDIARGVLNGRVYRQSLTASDCYEMGVIMLEKKDYLNALAWQMEALRKYKLEDNIPHSITEIDIMENIATIYDCIDATDAAIDWNVKILDLDPSNQRAQKKLLKYDGYDDIEDEDDYNTKVDDVKNATKVDSGVKDDNDMEATDAEDPGSNNMCEENDVQNEVNDKLETCPKDYDKNGTSIKDKADIFGESDINNVDSKPLTKDNGQEKTRNITNAKIDNDVRNYTNNNNAKDKRHVKWTRSRLIDSVVDIKRNTLRFEAMCRGEYDIAPEISSRLTCHYLNDKPFLKLAPIKAEQKYISPDIFIFYDVISDEEIAHVQELAKPHFDRAKVSTSNKVSEVRIGETSWLNDSHSEVVDRLSQRVADCSGLNLRGSAAEWLQVCNYGMGGHFLIHYDFDVNVLEESPTDSHRFATAMFYMSNVKQGGATVFPRLGLSVLPVKGSLVFWRNLLPSGGANLYTLHAACPVLEGTKWVANKWIQTHGQEIKTPCRPEEKLQLDIWPPPPVLKADMDVLKL